MTDLVRSETVGGLAVLTMNNPPLNALGHGLRQRRPNDGPHE